MTCPLTDSDKLDVARRYTAAAATGDGEAMLAMAADDAVVWHNFDELEVPLADTLAPLAWLHSVVADLAWETVAVVPTPEGYMQQSVLSGTAPGGPLRLHTCVVVRLDDDGRVRRIDEYLDSAQTSVLTS